MRTVRFSQVVAKAGRPEVYLLFDPNGAEFKKALRAHRIMTVVEQRAATSYGTVGYDASQHGQLLLFPKSLESFNETRVVGIKFDLFAEPPEEKRVTKPKPQPPKKRHPERKVYAKKIQSEAKKQKSVEPKRESSEPAPKPVKQAKVIAFPPPNEKDEDPRVEDLKQLARKALAALNRRRLREVETALTELLKS